MSNAVLIPEGAVYVYRNAKGALEFRRPDHKAPTGLDVRHLAGIAWTDHGAAKSVSMQARPLDDVDVTRALAWAAANRQPVVAPSSLFPAQQNVFHDLVKHEVATLFSPLGTGGNRILAAAALARAAQAGATHIHVMAGYAAFNILEMEFEALQGSGPRILPTRVDTAPRLEELAVDGEIVLVLPDTVSRNRSECGPLRVKALADVTSRGGVVYIHHNDSTQLAAYPGVTARSRSQNPTTAEFATAFAR